MIREHYQQRFDEIAAKIAVAEQQSDRLTILRAAFFFPAAAGFGLGWWGGGLVAWYAMGTLLFFGFLAAVACHEQLIQRLQRLRIASEIQATGLARLDRNWGHIPSSPVTIADDDWGTCHDLDLFGDASLFRLLRTAYTPAGIRTLRDWLLHPASPDVLRLRQAAVRSLGPQWEWRQALELEGRLLEDRGDSVAKFLQWAEGPAWLTRRRGLVGLVRLLPILIVVFGCLLAIQAIAPEIALTVLACGVAGNLLIIVLFAGKVHELFQQIHRDGEQVQRYLALFALIDALPHDMPGVEAIREEALQRGGGVQNQFRQLQRITALAMFPRASLFFVFIYLPLQFLTLYDFHLLLLYEAWQCRNREFVRTWFDALGRLEALASLATVHHDHPEWAFPEVRLDLDRIEVKAMGHPLLRDDRCVRNDVCVGPPGSVLFVTGSNMSGKSTLLRALGVNAVLAQAGAPVCAAGFLMPPVRLATSIRVTDSLAEGISFYMAELLRLRMVVDRAKESDAPDSPLTLYLLDEILLGTNSRERHLAVVRVLEFLRMKRAIGAITTHDLDLAEHGPLADLLRCVHFQETVHGPEAPQPITFDYRLRGGVATTTNALRLLELVGLGTEKTRSPANKG